MLADKSFEILLDSTSDLDKQLAEEYDICSIPGHITVNGVDQPAPLDWDFMPREDFYAALKANPTGYTACPPSVGEMAAEMTRMCLSGMGVLYLTISDTISGTYSFALQARDMVLAEYPKAQIRILDTRRFGPAISLMAVHASMMRASGLTLDEVYNRIIETRNTYHQAGWLDDLSFVAAKGRMTHAKAYLGTLMGIKPIGEFDYNGLTTVIGKAKGEKSAFKALMGYIAATIKNPEEQIIFVATADRHKQAAKYKQLIEETFKPRAVVIKDVYAMNGINVGPGLMAAYYTGTEISSDLEKEKSIIEDIL